MTKRRKQPGSDDLDNTATGKPVVRQTGEANDEITPRRPLVGNALVAAAVADQLLIELARQGAADFERGDYVRWAELRKQLGDV